MLILHTDLCKFPKLLTRRICLTTKSFVSWWSFLLWFREDIVGRNWSQSVVGVAALSIGSVATSSECDVNLSQVTPHPTHPLQPPYISWGFSVLMLLGGERHLAVTVVWLVPNAWFKNKIKKREHSPTTHLLVTQTSENLSLLKKSN